MMAAKDLLEDSRRWRHLLRVRTLRTMLIVALALLWVPLMSHCKLESIPGFEFLHCASDAQGSPANPGHCGAGCCSVESAKYQAPRNQETTPVVVVVILPCDLLSDLAQSLPPEVSLGILTAAPPELPTSWQFTSRTALPPRAPSLAS